MRFITFLFLGLFFIGLQTTLLQFLPKWMGIPDLLFLLIVFISIHFPTATGITLTFIFGILLEALSGYFLGIYAIAYFLVFLIIKGLSTGLAIDESNHQPPIVALTYLMANGIVYLCTAMLADNPLNHWGWGEILQRLLIITILVVPMNIIFEFFAKLSFKNTNDRQAFLQIFQQQKGNRYRNN